MKDFFKSMQNLMVSFIVSKLTIGIVSLTSFVGGIYLLTYFNVNAFIQYMIVLVIAYGFVGTARSILTAFGREKAVLKNV